MPRLGDVQLGPPPPQEGGGVGGRCSPGRTERGRGGQGEVLLAPSPALLCRNLTKPQSYSPSASPLATASQPLTLLPTAAPRPLSTHSSSPRHQALGQPWPRPASKARGARSTRKPAPRTLRSQAAPPANPTCARPPGTPAPTEACGGGVLRAGRGQMHGQRPPAQRPPGRPGSVFTPSDAAGGPSLSSLLQNWGWGGQGPALGPSLLGRTQGLPLLDRDHCRRGGHLGAQQLCRDSPTAASGAPGAAVAPAPHCPCARPWGPRGQGPAPRRATHAPLPDGHVSLLRSRWAQGEAASAPPEIQGEDSGGLRRGWGGQARRPRSRPSLAPCSQPGLLPRSHSQ